MTNPAKLPDPLKGPFVVVPLPGTQGLAVALNRLVRDGFGREFMGGTTYGFEEKSAVSLLLAGYGAAFCFDEEAAERWMKALKDAEAFEKLAGSVVDLEKGRADLMQKVIARFCGPFIEKTKAEQAARIAELAEADRIAAEEKQKADAIAAQKKLEEDQAAADAAEKKRLMDEANKEGNLSVALVDKPPALVSDVNTDGDTAREPTPPAPKPDAPKETKRGDKSPRK